ncbi:MAG: carbonic anhydrase, partial [Gammaproteobacteria bacterium]
MKILSIIMLGIIVNSNIIANEAAHWGYNDKMGPSQWAKIDKHNFMCSKGKNQSPINITQADSATLERIKFNYSSSLKNIVNNGHTVQVNINSGSDISINNSNYELKQFHFHTPSENTIDGKSYPLEAHFVHQNKTGELAVIAIMFETTGENKTISSLWKALKDSQAKSDKVSLPDTALSLLPKDKAYYRFNGSLTTPPCSEG